MTDWNPARTPLRTGVSERALRHDNRAWPPIASERLGDRGAHEFGSGARNVRTSI